MKKRQSGVWSVLRAAGITPSVVAAMMFLCFVFGAFMAIMIRRPPEKKRAIAPAPAIELSQEEASAAAIASAIEPLIANTQFEENSLNFTPATGLPVIAIIIDDMGIDMIRSAQILDIDAPLDVSYLTYAPNLQAQVDGAKAKGKEVMLHVPMEAKAATYDLGPVYLSTTRSSEDNVALFRKLVGNIHGIVGINNHMGSKFTSDDAQISAIISETGNMGLAFVDSLTAPKTGTRKMALAANVAYAARDVFLDDSPLPDDISRSFALLEAIAKKKGYAVAIGHPRANTIPILKSWLETAQSRGFAVAPLSYIIKNKTKSH